MVVGVVADDEVDLGCYSFYVDPKLSLDLGAQMFNV